MADLIDRDKLIDEIVNSESETKWSIKDINSYLQGKAQRQREIMDIIQEQPQAGMEKHAHWIDERNRFDCLFKCSNCHTDFYLEEGTPEENDYNYCPNCGATMNKEKMQ